MPTNSTEAQERAAAAQRVADAVTGSGNILDEGIMLPAVEVNANKPDKPGMMYPQQISLPKKQFNPLDNVVTSMEGMRNLESVLGRSFNNNKIYTSPRDKTQTQRNPSNEIFDFISDKSIIPFTIFKEFNLNAFLQEGISINTTFSVIGSGVSRKKVNNSIEVSISLNGFVPIQSQNDIKWAAIANVYANNNFYTKTALKIPDVYFEEKDNPYKPIGVTTFVLPKNVQTVKIIFEVSFYTIQSEGTINPYSPLNFTVNVPVPK